MQVGGNEVAFCLLKMLPSQFTPKKLEIWCDTVQSKQESNCSDCTYVCSSEGLLGHHWFKISHVQSLIHILWPRFWSVWKRGKGLQVHGASRGTGHGENSKIEKSIWCHDEGKSMFFILHMLAILTSIQVHCNYLKNYGFIFCNRTAKNKNKMHLQWHGKMGGEEHL